MRSTTTTRSLILGAVVAGALTLGAVQMASGDSGPAAEKNPGSSPSSTPNAPDKDRPKVKTATERGIVLEGSGTWRGNAVQVFVYENRKYGNSLQILIGDPDDRHTMGSGEGRDPYVIDGVLNVGLDIDGDLAVVKGSVTPNGEPVPAAEEAPDGELISATGTHTPLLVKATFAYRGETVRLRFAKAFAYELKSIRSGK